MDIPELPDHLKEKPPAAAPTKWIQVHQHKANSFRVVHADGVWCSVNPQQQIHLTFYSERSPLPTSVFFPVAEDGKVLQEDIAKREVKHDWFREMEVDVSLSIAVAKSVHEALGRWITAAEDFPSAPRIK